MLIHFCDAFRLDTILHSSAGQRRVKDGQDNEMPIRKERIVLLQLLSHKTERV